MSRSVRRRHRWFVDTSAFFAILNVREDDHLRAMATIATAQTQGAQLTTSSYIVAETHALMLNRIGYGHALRFLNGAESLVDHLEWVTPWDVALAVDLIRGHSDKTYSLTDATSFVLMERLGIATAFAFDRDFLRYGFEQARPS